jgi:hypothetical protein
MQSAFHLFKCFKYNMVCRIGWIGYPWKCIEILIFIGPRTGFTYPFDKKLVIQISEKTIAKAGLKLQRMVGIGPLTRPSRQQSGPVSGCLVRYAWASKHNDSGIQHRDLPVAFDRLTANP